MIILTDALSRFVMPMFLGVIVICIVYWILVHSIKNAFMISIMKLPFAFY